MLNNIKLTLEYDGTNYYGWQKQKGFKTIQGEIEEAIELVTKEHCEVIGSSRTDAGVHARGFVANFKTNSKVPPNKFREALNVKLPNDIVIIKSEQVDEEFHARYYAKGKTYEYYILNSDVPSALMRNQMYHYKYDLDVEAMKIAHINGQNIIFENDIYNTSIEYLNNDKLVVKNSYSQGYFSTEYTNTYIKR
jgi:tRNA pseudouridine38-40 synthase